MQKSFGKETRGQKIHLISIRYIKINFYISINSIKYISSNKYYSNNIFTYILLLEEIYKRMFIKSLNKQNYLSKI